ncbi:peptide chain release factor N(5)-glutamine methyltransferase [Rasiella rasia]|uniref:Release factor glutamine methyltransferase n=1 Tax=Rasiella rasia TaxID=2744027 RepID=A0A6G6GQF7_9FLAO|nr:peptide chain release factor N(5)-glutamine methyltransferase [Rasiella rasia]QIE60704.1 peptide chain release factor N(5)-glutamine methyltransferase [Rasiella rasia]
MTLKQLKSNFTATLSENYPLEEVATFFNWLAEAYLGYSRFDISSNGPLEVTSNIETKFLDAMKRLQNYEPIQYIIGDTEFFGLPFKVTPATLIPRPETEELVQWILSDFENVAPSILDIGTGSGCIAISLAKNLENAAVSAVDISEEALHIAKQNALDNEVSVNFYQADILALNTLPHTYDCIVSNPPYVRALEKEFMQPNVLKHEPESALFVSNDNPLVFYTKIARLAEAHLSVNGTLYFEINEYLGKEMQDMLKAEGFAEIELRKDIFGKDRMLRCKRH